MDTDGKRRSRDLFYLLFPLIFTLSRVVFCTVSINGGQRMRLNDCTVAVLLTDVLYVQSEATLGNSLLCVSRSPLAKCYTGWTVAHRTFVSTDAGICLTGATHGGCKPLRRVERHKGSPAGYTWKSVAAGGRKTQRENPQANRECLELSVSLLVCLLYQLIICLMLYIQSDLWGQVKGKTFLPFWGEYHSPFVLPGVTDGRQEKRNLIIKAHLLWNHKLLLQND